MTRGTIVLTFAVKGNSARPIEIYFCAPADDGVRAIEAWWQALLALLPGRLNESA